MHETDSISRAFGFVVAASVCEWLVEKFQPEKLEVRDIATQSNTQQMQCTLYVQPTAFHRRNFTFFVNCLHSREQNVINSRFFPLSPPDHCSIFFTASNVHDILSSVVVAVVYSFFTTFAMDCPLIFHKILCVFCHVSDWREGNGK